MHYELPGFMNADVGFQLLRLYRFDPGTVELQRDARGSFCLSSEQNQWYGVNTRGVLSLHQARRCQVHIDTFEFLWRHGPGNFVVPVAAKQTLPKV